MLSHFILALSFLAIFIECRPEKNNNKLETTTFDNYDLEVFYKSEYSTNKPDSEDTTTVEDEEVNLTDYSDEEDYGRSERK